MKRFTFQVGTYSRLQKCNREGKVVSYQSERTKFGIKCEINNYLVTDLRSTGGVRTRRWLLLSLLTDRRVAAAHAPGDGFRFIKFNGAVDPALFVLHDSTTAPFIAVLVNY